jgi:hypothetical protein
VNTTDTLNAADRFLGFALLKEPVDRTGQGDDSVANRRLHAGRDGAAKGQRVEGVASDIRVRSCDQRSDREVVDDAADAADTLRRALGSELFA